MSDKNINLNMQRTTRSKSKVLADAENLSKQREIRVNYTQGEVIICQLCNKRGHTASACRSLANTNVYTKNPHNRVFNRFSPQQNMRQTN